MAFRKKDYHPKWQLIRRLIARRAGYSCEWCGAMDRLPHPVTGSKVICTVAHVAQNRKQNRFWLLAFLCQRCHLNWDRAFHQRSKNYGKGHRECMPEIFASEQREFTAVELANRLSMLGICTNYLRPYMMDEGRGKRGEFAGVDEGLLRA